MENNEIVATTFLNVLNNHSLLTQGSASLRISLYREFCGLRIGQICLPGQVHAQLKRQMVKEDGAGEGKWLSSQEVLCRE